MTDDGTSAPLGTVIERVCNGTPHSEGYTDRQGYFSVTLGQSSEVVMDASESGSGTFRQNVPVQSGPMSNGGTANGGNSSGGGMAALNRYSNCEIRARLGGYQSQQVNLFNHSSLGSPDIGTILIHRLGGGEEATTISASTLRASKAGRKALQKGTDFAKKGKIDEAIASYQEAVKSDPDFAFAWCALGKLQAQKEQKDDARQSFETAAKFEPRWPEPLLQLAYLAGLAHDWKSLTDLSERVLRLDSFSYPQAFYFNAVGHYNLHHLEAAEKAARSAQKLDVQHQYPELSHMLGTMLATRHEYAEAADQLRSYLVQAPHADDAAATRRQLDTIEHLALQSSATVARKEPE